MNIASSSPSPSLALSFTESPMFISPLTSDDSSYPSPNMSYDGILHLSTPLRSGYWAQPSATLRGGYRFLTFVSTSSTPVSISNITCAISFMPHVQDLRNYSGYFYAKDPVFHDQDFLTKVPFLLFSLTHVLTGPLPQDMVRWSLYCANKYGRCQHWSGSALRKLSGLGK